ncbi:MAG: response regulator [Nitrospira sp.]|nr:response regulator [Nitrospira sp.]
MDTFPAREDKKPTILIVDDEAGPRDAVKVILRPFFNTRSAENASSAMTILNAQTIDLIVLDQKLPDRQGIDLLQDIKHAYADVEVIIITGHGSVESAMEGILHGAAGYLLKPFNVTELITLVNQTLEKKRRLDCIRGFFRSSSALWGSDQESAAAWQRLTVGYQALLRPAEGSSVKQEGDNDILRLLSEVLESTNRQLLNHSSRVSFYATLMGTRLNLSSEAQQTLVMGAFLHDIGKAHLVSDGLPVDQGSSSGEDVLRTQHPEKGARFIRSAGLPDDVCRIVLHHHERWDGQGFPHGLAKDEIPFLARIVSIAQTFDHVMTDLPGQPHQTVDQALCAIARESHTHFDPVLLDMFKEVLGTCNVSIPPMATMPVISSIGLPPFPSSARRTL